VHRATETLAAWSLSWQPYLPEMPTGTERIAHFAIYSSDSPRITTAFDAHARAAAERAHPEHRQRQQTAEHAELQWARMREDTLHRRMHLDARLDRYGKLGHATDLDHRLNQADQQLTAVQARIEQTSRRLDRLRREPAIATQPPGWLERQREHWQADDAAEAAARRRLTEVASALAVDAGAHQRLHAPRHHAARHDTGRHGPSIGR
jgi:hypothetical protein